MVDIHNHILPNVDDGSRSWEMTAEMCRIAADDGITHIVATPHCNYEFQYDRDHYEPMLERLRSVSEGRIEFSLGCDFHFSYENLTAILDDPLSYTINGTEYFLLEFSDYGLPPNLVSQLASLIAKGLIPIVTHPERNPQFLRRPEMVLDLVRSGALVQVTANALTGFWGGPARSMVQWLLQRGAVHTVATDAHDARSRTPVLSQARGALAEIVGEELAETLVVTNPLAIVEGREVTALELERNP